MRSLDTNVLLRFLLDDSPSQTAVAMAILKEPSLILSTVVVETVWYLSRVRKWPRAQLAEAFVALFAIEGVLVADDVAVRWAFDRFAAGADFADMLHLALSGAANSFATFDQDIARHADASVVAVETL